MKGDTSPLVRSDFDAQAEHFDERAGLPVEVVRELSGRLRTWGLESPGAWLEIGSGTGRIAELLTGHGRSYLALDISARMLRLVQARVDPATSLCLLADAQKPWPIATGRLALVFLSRVVHLLDHEELVAQLRRTCAPGARVAIGHRGRAAESVQEQLRREMGRRVAALTHERPADRSKRRKVLRDLQEAGAEAQPDEVVARWQSITRIDATLAGWGQKSVLAGVPLEPTTRDPLLAELAAWARERFGPLDVEHPCHEHFTLQSVRL